MSDRPDIEGLRALIAESPNRPVLSHAVPALLDRISLLEEALAKCLRMVPVDPSSGEYLDERADELASLLPGTKETAP